MSGVKRITLLRHAEALPPEGAQADRDRCLSPAGEHEAALAGQRLHATGARPSLILTSPATRALQTARLVAREINYPREFLQREPELYLASAAGILAVITAQDDAFNDILVCGHNPGLTALANQLTEAGISALPTGGFTIIEAAITCWPELQDSCRLQLIDAPDLPAT